MSELPITDTVCVSACPEKDTSLTLTATLNNHYIIRTTPYSKTVWELKHDRSHSTFYNDTYNRIMTEWDITKTDCSEIFKELRDITNPYVKAYAAALGVTYGY